MVPDEINERIRQIKLGTTAINDVNEIAANVASSVEEQAVTSQEIAYNVSQASQCIQEDEAKVAQSSTVAGTISIDRKRRQAPMVK